MNLFPRKASLSAWSLTLSLYTLVAFHIPFFRHVLGHIESGFNGVLIVISLTLLILTLNFFFYSFVAFLGRAVGKGIISFTLIGNAIALYFVNNYEVLITDQMMGNVFNTQFSEASGFYSVSFIFYVLLLGILPSVYVFARKVDYGSWKAFGIRSGSSLGLALVIAFGNMSNWPWIDRNSTELGALLMPWSYTVNSVRYYQAERARNAREILLPDARFTTDSRDVCILIIGESARSDHFSLLGYGKHTNRFTDKDSVTAYPALSSATYTIAGVKAILEPYDRSELYEILPNYLYRTGADVSWRTSNWGEPPVHVEKYDTKQSLKEKYPDADERYDGILLEGLEAEIRACNAAKQLIVLHTNTSHGPAYNDHYPPEFEVFTPVCNTVEMSKANREELLNAYDNSIVYTDWLIHSAISLLRSLPVRGCVLYVSDHGESLGENNLYMHGVPMAMAPREQIEIPFLLWTSDKALRIKSPETVGQHHVFHTVLRFMDVDTPVYDAQLSLFE